MYHVFASDIVLLDDVFTSLITAAVGKIEIDEVELLQPFVFLLTVRKCFPAGGAPCAPDVEQNDFPLVRFHYLTENLLAIAHVCHVFFRFQCRQFRYVHVLYGNHFFIHFPDKVQGIGHLYMLFGIFHQAWVERLLIRLNLNVQVSYDIDVAQCAVGANGIE